MTNTPTDPVVEFLVDGQWTDLVALGDVRLSSADSGGGIEIQRGMPNEGNTAEPTQLSFTLNNRHGEYTPENPNSSLYGKLGRNTPVRVGLNRVLDTFEGRTVVDGWGTASDGHAWSLIGTASKFDVASGSGTIETATGRVYAITGTYGDADVLIKFKISSRVTNAEMGVTIRCQADGSELVQFYITISATTDLLRYGKITPGGAAASSVNMPSNLVAGTWYWMQARCNGNQNRARIWADGDPVPNWMISVYDDDFYSAIGVPVPYGACGAYASTTGASIVSYDSIQIDSWRAHAEIAELPPRFDLSRFEQWVPIEARGVLRRLGQGRKALKSAVSRHLQSYVDGAAGAVVWIPLEDGNSTTFAGSNIAGAPNGQLTQVTFAADEDLPGVAAVANFGENGSRLTFTAKRHTGTGTWTYLMFCRIPSDPASELRLATVYASGTAKTWRIKLLPGSTLEVDCLNSTGTVLSTDTAPFYFSPERPQGCWTALTLYVFDSGGNINWALNYQLPGDALFYTTGTNVVAGSVGVFQGGVIGATQVHADAGGLFVAQVFAAPIDLPFVTAAFAEAARAYVGELAGDRFARLGDETGIAYRTLGVRANSAPMGPQRPAKLVELWEECAEVEGGILGESRVDMAVTLRLRYTMYNQRVLPLSIDSGHLSPPLEPGYGDQLTRNDVTVSRPGGSFARSVQTEGPLNVNEPEVDPIDGVGVYDEAPEINVAADSQLQDIADTRRGKGTLKEARYPSIHADLTATAYQSSPTLTAQASSIDSGDMLEITNPEVSPDPAEQIVNSYSETLDQYDWDITWNAQPGRIWRVGRLEQTTRADTQFSVTEASFVSGTDTTLSVERTDATKQLWITTATFPTHFNFDILVSGVRLRVTGITGTGDPQSMTVEQTPINGIIKTIPVGSPVRLYEPWRLAR